MSALRAFEAAARTLNLSAAARELGVTPAAVSYQVRSLEKQLRRQLFIRRNRGMSLSAAGMRLSESLTEHFAQIARAVAEVSPRDMTSLEVTAMPSFATKWLAPKLPRFGLAHPECRVRVAASDELVDLRHSSADVGLRYGRGNYPGVHVELLTRVTAFPVCSPSFAETNAQWLQQAGNLPQLVLLHDETSLIAAGLPNWQLWLEAAGIRRRGAKQGLVFDSAHMALEAAIAGQGVALALGPLVADDLHARRLVHLFDLQLPSPFSFWFACSRSRIGDAKVAQFRDWLTAEMAVTADRVGGRRSQSTSAN